MGQVANIHICSGLFLSVSLTLNVRQNEQSNCGMWALYHSGNFSHCRAILNKSKKVGGFKRGIPFCFLVSRNESPAPKRKHNHCHKEDEEMKKIVGSGSAGESAAKQRF